MIIQENVTPLNELTTPRSVNSTQETVKKHPPLSKIKLQDMKLMLEVAKYNNCNLLR
jgi:hypothetical protein